MIRLPKRCQMRKGSAILVAIGVLVILLVFLSSFLKSTTSRVHTTKKLGDAMLARELANSLANIAFHYIKNIELKNEGSTLVKTLSLPMPFKNNNNEEGDLLSGIKTITDGSDNIVDVLLSKSELRDIKIEKFIWQVYKDDFKQLKLGKKYSPYPREKKGLIRVYIKFSYKLPGQTNPITEDYAFASNIKVVANILPVLSKFNLYIKDSFGGNKPTSEDDTALFSRFNIVKTTAGGEIKEENKPWVLKNGCDNGYYDDYKDFIENPKGFVYLGGGTNNIPIVLGIARGFTEETQGEYGEDFHLYKKGTGGYWKTFELWDDTQGFLAAEIGLCDDESTDKLKAWQIMFGNYYKELSKKNSIFRLFGTDKKQSPTIVLGYVNSMRGRVKAYKGPSGTNKLAYFDKFDPDFIAFTGLSPDIDDSENISAALQYSQGLSLTKFAMAYSQKTNLDNNSKDELKKFYQEYIDIYCSKLTTERYNKDYAYIFARTKGLDDDGQAYPLDFGNNLIKDNLHKLCKKEANEIFEKIPSSNNAKYSDIYGEKELDNLDKMLNPEILFIDGSDNSKNDRIAYIASENDSFEEYLKLKGLLKKNSANKLELDINGWIYIDNSKEFTIDFNNYINTSNCGIICTNGIKINGNITKEESDDTGAQQDKHMTIISLKGNIIINSSVNIINASLIAANGEIKIESGSNNLTINGNIVMKKLNENTIKNNFKRLVKLNYNENLAAIPYDTKIYGESESEAEKLKRTEYPLLMFSLEDNVKKLD